MSLSNSFAINTRNAEVIPGPEGLYTVQETYMSHSAILAADALLQ